MPEAPPPYNPLGDALDVKSGDTGNHLKVLDTIPQIQRVPLPDRPTTPLLAGTAGLAASAAEASGTVGRNDAEASAVPAPTVEPAVAIQAAQSPAEPLIAWPNQGSTGTTFGETIQAEAPIAAEPGDAAVSTAGAGDGNGEPPPPPEPPPQPEPENNEDPEIEALRKIADRKKPLTIDEARELGKAKFDATKNIPSVLENGIIIHGTQYSIDGFRTGQLGNFIQAHNSDGNTILLASPGTYNFATDHPFEAQAKKLAKQVLDSEHSPLLSFKDSLRVRTEVDQPNTVVLAFNAPTGVNLTDIMTTHRVSLTDALTIASQMLEVDGALSATVARSSLVDPKQILWDPENHKITYASIYGLNSPNPDAKPAEYAKFIFEMAAGVPLDPNIPIEKQLQLLPANSGKLAAVLADALNGKTQSTDTLHSSINEIKMFLQEPESPQPIPEIPTDPELERIWMMLNDNDIDSVDSGLSRDQKELIRMAIKAGRLLNEERKATDPEEGLRLATDARDASLELGDYDSVTLPDILQKAAERELILPPNTAITQAAKEQLLRILFFKDSITPINKSTENAITIAENLRVAEANDPHALTVNDVYKMFFSEASAPPPQPDRTELSIPELEEKIAEEEQKQVQLGQEIIEILPQLGKEATPVQDILTTYCEYQYLLFRANDILKHANGNRIMIQEEDKEMLRKAMEFLEVKKDEAEDLFIEKRDQIIGSEPEKESVLNTLTHTVVDFYGSQDEMDMLMWDIHDLQANRSTAAQQPNFVADVLADTAGMAAYSQLETIDLSDPRPAVEACVNYLVRYNTDLDRMPKSFFEIVKQLGPDIKNILISLPPSTSRDELLLEIES